jgi:ribosomal protein L37AE/L43A
MQPRAAGTRPQWEKLAMSTDEKRTCEVCNAAIPAARVRAIPGTWLCIECSEDVGGDYVYTAKQENLGKAGSLKLNYGGVTVTKKRRTIRPKSE